MAKRNFEKVIADTVAATNYRSEADQAKEKFKAFLDAAIPEVSKVYDWAGNDVLIEIFSFEPENELDAAMGVGSGNTIYYPLARVLAAGSDTHLAVGDVVKLRDSEVTTVENPEYRAWMSNELSKSSMKQKGKEPARYGSNVVKTFGPYIFSLNPLERKDELYFKVPSSKIENRIVDVNYLFSN